VSNGTFQGIGNVRTDDFEGDMLAASVPRIMLMSTSTTTSTRVDLIDCLLLCGWVGFTTAHITGATWKLVFGGEFPVSTSTETFEIRN
jgi:hypothetical protein